ncbi:hypothetical protein [Fibrobacter sp.]|nr:hypothetical protein [Fibrobacter sp.]
MGTKCQTQAVKIAWAAAADGFEANDADGDNCKRRVCPKANVAGPLADL